MPYYLCRIAGEDGRIEIRSVLAPIGGRMPEDLRSARASSSSPSGATGTGSATWASGWGGRSRTGTSSCSTRSSWP
ncbi:MAG: hypothetical protein MZV64_32765 [Ignavibacteriales bacterium]|nr:hypothetical protein [Ignavibacteriales bacterium]